MLLIKEAILAYDVPVIPQMVTDGEQAIEVIQTIDKDDNVPCPRLVILDLNLPKKNGLEVLEHLRRSRRCANLPVIVVTSSDSRQDREQTVRPGATRYFRKPSDYEQFLKLGEVLKQVLDNQSAGATSAQ
jgi:chemotaxis family two-component system response regulator Rcp1